MKEGTSDPKIAFYLKEFILKKELGYTNSELEKTDIDIIDRDFYIWSIGKELEMQESNKKSNKMKNLIALRKK